jgi:hypothetical protein
MRSIALQQKDAALMYYKILCRKKEDALSDRGQACAKQEGEIEDQLKKLKMRDDLVQQQENACAQCEKCVRGEEGRYKGVNISLNKRAEELVKREDVCTRLKGEIDVALRNIYMRECNCNAKIKEVGG